MLKLVRIENDSENNLNESVHRKVKLCENQKLSNKWNPYQSSHTNIDNILSRNELKRLMSKLKQATKDDKELKSLLEEYEESVDSMKEYILQLMNNVKNFLDFVRLDIG